MHTDRCDNTHRQKCCGYCHTYQNSQLVKKRTCKDTSKDEKATEQIHHPKADVNRLYSKRRNGGCGLVKLESTYNAATVGLSEYIKEGKDRLTRLVQKHDVENQILSAKRS